MPLFQITPADKSSLFVYATSASSALDLVREELEELEVSEINIKLLLWDESVIRAKELNTGIGYFGSMIRSLSRMADELTTSRELCEIQRTRIAGLMREWEQLKEERDKAREERDRVSLERVKAESTLNEARELTRVMAKELKVK